MTVFLDWRFLNIAKRGKNLAGLSLFDFVFMRSYGESSYANRLSFGDTVAVVCRFVHKS